MTHIACILTRRLARVLAPALVLAALGCREDTESPTAPEPAPALDITPAHTLSFRQVNAGFGHTCGVTTNNLAYCWGFNAFGQLGDGTTTILRLTPVAVAGGLLFRQVSAGFAHTCGVTTNNLAYCWGFNASGRLGDGTTALRLMPVLVHAGARRFRQVIAGDVPTCGVTTDSLAFCWGGNFEGQLGDGTTTDRLTPVRVAGGHHFRQISEGSHHSCAVTTGDQAFCWGGNPLGELGDGTTTNRLTPVAVAPPAP